MLQIRTSPPPRLLVDEHSSAHHRVECTHFFFCIQMFWLPCCQREEPFSSASFSFFRFVVDISAESLTGPSSQTFSFLSSLAVFLAFPSMKSCVPQSVPCIPKDWALTQFPTNSGRKQEKKSEFDGDCAVVVDSIKAK